MARRAFARRWLAAAVGIGLAAVLMPCWPAVADGGVSEVVVPAGSRTEVRQGNLLGATGIGQADATGAQGFYHTEEGLSGTLWTRFTDGKSFPVPAAPTGTTLEPTGSDVLAYVTGRRIELRDPVDGAVRSVTVPDDQTYQNVYGSTVVTYTTPDGGTTIPAMHLLSPGDGGTTRDVPITGAPQGTTFGSPSGGDATTVVFPGTVDGRRCMILVDSATGRFSGSTVTLASSYRYPELTPEYLAVYSATDRTVLLFPRKELAAAPTALKLGSGVYNSTTGWAVVGDSLVYQPANSISVRAAPLTGGAEVTLLQRGAGRVLTGSGGTAITVGGTDADDWGVRRISPAADGSPVVSMAKALPPVPGVVQGISLEQGQLVVTDRSSGHRAPYVRMAAADGSPAYGPRSALWSADVVMADCETDQFSCSQIFGTGDGRVAWLEQGTSRDVIRVNGTGSTGYAERSVPAGGTIKDVTGKYVVADVAGQEYVYRIGDSGTPLTRKASASAVWADRLWTPGSAAGSVTALDLVSRTTVETVDTGGQCVPTELQAVGRWLYWNCGAEHRAGVYDRTAKKSLPVPADEALLGDGYVVTHDSAAGKLVLTGVAPGSAPSHTVADFPAAPGSTRHVRWTVDRFGGQIAYADAQERVHIVQSGVAAQPLDVIETATTKALDVRFPGPAAGTEVFAGLLTRPAASWNMTVRDKATGAVVRTYDHGETRGRLSATWDGRKAAGGPFVPEGAYTWTVTAEPADGVGAAVTRTGTLRLTGAVRRDHTGDGFADALTLNSKGEFTFQHGDGVGSFSGKTTGGGWPTTAFAVPFGDFNGDACNDVLVRLVSGALRAYKPACGKAITPTTAYVAVGAGWQQYNVLTSPGDLNGDGLADLVARQTSTGDMYFYAGRSDGKFATKVQFASGWTGYGQIAGAGDLTGDGRADLLAHDKNGVLWRYNGTGKGTFAARAQVFKAWGTSYNTIVGVGDITGDGKGDLIERDSAGKLFRNAGNGKGSFGSRTQIATGWQGYKGVF